MTVRPSMLGSIAVMLPMNVMMETSSVATRLIHRAARMKLTRQITARPKGNLVPNLSRGGRSLGAHTSMAAPSATEATAVAAWAGQGAPVTLPATLNSTQTGSPVQLATKKGLKYISPSTAGIVSVLATVKGISKMKTTLLKVVSSLKKAQPSCLTLCTKAWMDSWLLW